MTPANEDGHVPEPLRPEDDGWYALDWRVVESVDGSGVSCSPDADGLPDVVYLRGLIAGEFAQYLDYGICTIQVRPCESQEPWQDFYLGE